MACVGVWAVTEQKTDIREFRLPPLASADMRLEAGFAPIFGVAKHRRETHSFCDVICTRGS
jgi:hypothetical protein